MQSLVEYSLGYSLKVHLGEMSHAEVARRTEKALKRNEERAAEREERRQRLAEARAAREQGLTPQRPTPSKKRDRKPKKVTKPVTTPTVTPKAPKSRKRTAPAPPTPKMEEIEKPRDDLQAAISYSARVFAAVEKEIQSQINTSTKRHARMRDILEPKIKKESKTSYENKLVQSITKQSTRNPLLWNNIGKSTHCMQPMVTKYTDDVF